MNKGKTKSLIQYPAYTKIWLLIYLLISLIFGLNYFYTHVIYIPYIAFALINLYAIALLLLKSKQGFYTLVLAEIIFSIYSLTRIKTSVSYLIALFNLIFTFITRISIRHLWEPQ